MSELISKVLKTGEYAALAITDGNDPYILNLHYGYDPVSGNLYFLSDKGGMKLDFLKSNSYVCGSIVIKEPAGEETSPQYGSVIFRGVIEVIHNPEEQALALCCLKSQPGYSPDQKDISNPMIMKLDMEEIDGRVRPCS